MKSTEILYTVWFSDPHTKRVELLNEEEMREAGARYGFDPERVVFWGEDWLWSEGVTPYDNPRSASDDIYGGCYSEKC